MKLKRIEETLINQKLMFRNKAERDDEFFIQFVEVLWFRLPWRVVFFFKGSSCGVGANFGLWCGGAGTRPTIPCVSCKSFANLSTIVKTCWKKIVQNPKKSYCCENLFIPGPRHVRCILSN